MGLISIRLMNAPTNHVPANPPHVHTPISDDKRLPSELFMHWRGPSTGLLWGGVSIVVLQVSRWSLFFPLTCLVSSSPDLKVLLNLPCRWLRDASQLGRSLWPMVHPTQSYNRTPTHTYIHTHTQFMFLISLCWTGRDALEAINGLVMKEHGSFTSSLFNTFSVWV